MALAIKAVCVTSAGMVAVGASDTVMVGLGGEFIGQATTPAAPSSGNYRLYFKTDGKLYKQTSAGVETEIGGGGGGLTNFDEAAFTSSPNNTVNVAQLTPDAALSTNADIVIQPKGTGSILGQVPDSTTTGGNKRGVNATDWQRKRTSATQVASGDDSVLGGGQNNTASGSQSSVGGGAGNTASGAYARVGGGYNNTASSTFSFVGGGMGNTASHNYSFVGAGYSNSASGPDAFVGSGASNVASGSYSVIGGGQSNQATGTRSTICGGSFNTANASDTAILGGASNTVNSKNYALMIGHYGKGIDHGDIIVAPYTTNTTQGLYQHRIVGLRCNTTNATPLALSTANSTTYILVPSYYAATFRIQVIGRSNATGNEMASFVVDGSVFRQSAASTTTVSATVTVISRTTVTMDCTVTADTTYGGVIITVTGVASKTISWYAYADLTEINGSS